MTLVAIDRLRTSLAALRGSRTERTELAALPIRVAACDGGFFEVLDGFKRLARWRGEGRAEIAVVVETAEGVERKARLLSANSPGKTASAMDEARVVASLSDEDGMSAMAIGKLLGRKKLWVERRLSLARRLPPEAAARLDRGRMAILTALALAEFGAAEQRRLAETCERQGLSCREAAAFLATWRVAPDAATREALARDPRTASPREREQPGASPLGARAAEIAARLDALEAGLCELATPLDGLSDPERRALEARRRRIVFRMKEVLHDAGNAGGNPGDGGADDAGPRDREKTGDRSQDGEARPRTAAAGGRAPEARALQGSGREARSLGTPGSEDSPRDPGAGLPRLADDPQRIPALDSTADETAESGGPQIRNRAGEGSPDGLEPLPAPDRRHRADGALLLDDPRVLAPDLHRVLPRREAADAPSRPR
jgi:hypothetical protein